MNDRQGKDSKRHPTRGQHHRGNIVTITMEAPDALALASDLDFLARYRDPNGMTGKVSGQVEHNLATERQSK